MIHLHMQTGGFTLPGISALFIASRSVLSVGRVGGMNRGRGVMFAHTPTRDPEVFEGDPVFDLHHPGDQFRKTGRLARRKGQVVVTAKLWCPWAGFTDLRDAVGAEND